MTGPSTALRLIHGDGSQLLQVLCSGSEAGSYLQLIDSCITHLKAQGASRTCNESKEEEAFDPGRRVFRVGLAPGKDLIRQQSRDLPHGRELQRS